jgi:hypothetical protein
MIGYRLILPAPWVCINLEDNLAEDVAKVVDRAAARTPKSIPPDQLAAVRRRMRLELSEQLRTSREYGAVDFYFRRTTSTGWP